MDRMSESMMVKEQKRDEQPRNPQGALHHAGDDGHAHGDHPGYVMKTSLYTRANSHPVLKNTLMAAATAAATWWLLGKRNTNKVKATSTRTDSSTTTDSVGTSASPISSTTPSIEDHGIVATHHETVPLTVSNITIVP
ncbi:hypothetical protein [Hymenobacter volaticus]|uniref:Uncharacterized protein n=1 Tax=Hymenobacter volaticus TaxID=2932254 RepID=A0ABY4G379_9BACT|nr:hypothetical protein [Hymenobacter volaticus]UOQ65325.1 hypothetical protein MUN86_17470 [Hymenobacter volaticus]